MQKLISLIKSHVFIFILTLLPWETDPENMGRIYVRECFAYVSSKEFYGVLSYIQILKTF